MPEEKRRGLVVVCTRLCASVINLAAKEDHETWLMSFIAPALLQVAREPRGREVARGSASGTGYRTKLRPRHILKIQDWLTM